MFCLRHRAIPARLAILIAGMLSLSSRGLADELPQRYFPAGILHAQWSEFSAQIGRAHV